MERLEAGGTMIRGPAMVKADSARRGAILIEPYKQLRFGVVFLVINLVFSLLLFAVFGYFLWDVYEALSVYFQLDESQSVIAMAKITRPALIGLILIGLFIGTTLFMSVRYTHQIYGPLVSVRRFLDDLVQGRNPEPLQLRSSDQLHDLIYPLNKLSQMLMEGGPGLQPPLSGKAALMEQLDCLVRGGKAKEVELGRDDPLCEIAARVNQLVRKNGP